MVKYYYCNLCGAKCEYEHGGMPRICAECKPVEHRLYYKYEKKPPKEHLKGIKNKQLCLGRDGYKCVLCESTIRVDVHHRDGNSYRKMRNLANNKLDNLITLCHSCHMKLHDAQGDLPAKEERTLKMIAYHNEHPRVRQAVLARMFGLSRERVGQILGRVRKR